MKYLDLSKYYIIDNYIPISGNLLIIKKHFFEIH
jgi:hypothetical protein